MQLWRLLRITAAELLGSCRSCYKTKKEPSLTKQAANEHILYSMPLARIETAQIKVRTICFVHSKACFLCHGGLLTFALCSAFIRRASSTVNAHSVLGCHDINSQAGKTATPCERRAFAYHHCIYSYRITKIRVGRSTIAYGNTSTIEVAPG